MSLPRRSEIKTALCRVLAASHGPTRAADLIDMVTSHFPLLTREDLMAREPNGGNVWRKMVQWEAQKLKQLGWIVIVGKAGNQESTWQLTSKGRDELDEPKVDGQDLFSFADRYEGALRRMIKDVPVRNRAARGDCLAEWGYRCQVCKMTFEERYGPAGKGLIHIHHKNPISRTRQSRKVDGKRDLIPLCPNCHAMLHWTDLTIEELRRMVR